MLLYRISSSKYADDISGEGAFRNGGRWNSKGKRIIYTSTSIALSSLEVLVHTDGVPIRKGLSLTTFQLSDKYITALEALPEDWNSKPPSQSTRIVGDGFIDKKVSLGLKVPSVIVPEEYNVLINPLHIDMDKLSIVGNRTYVFDTRL